MCMCVCVRARVRACERQVSKFWLPNRAFASERSTVECWTGREMQLCLLEIHALIKGAMTEASSELVVAQLDDEA